MPNDTRSTSTTDIETVRRILEVAANSGVGYDVDPEEVMKELASGELVDIRPALVEQLYNDMEVDVIDPSSSEYYRRLPSPDPENYPEVFVHNEHAMGWTPAHEWHVSAGLDDMFDCDYEEAQLLAGAIAAAVYQAKILNAQHGYRIPVSAFQRGVTAAPVYLTRVTETKPGPWVSYFMKEEAGHLEGKQPGYTWGGDPDLPDFDTRCEYLGRFQLLTVEILDGRSYAIMTEADA